MGLHLIIFAELSQARSRTPKSAASWEARQMLGGGADPGALHVCPERRACHLHKRRKSRQNQRARRGEEVHETKQQEARGGVGQQVGGVDGSGDYQ